MVSSLTPKDISKIISQEQHLKNIIYDNIELLAFLIFKKKGIRESVKVKKHLKIYHKDYLLFKLSISKNISLLSENDIPFNILETLASLYDKELMNELIFKENNIKFKNLGLNYNMLVDIYIYYIKNRKHFIKYDVFPIKEKKSIKEVEVEKLEKLKSLVQNLYKE